MDRCMEIEIEYQNVKVAMVDSKITEEKEHKTFMKWNREREQMNAWMDGWMDEWTKVKHIAQQNDDILSSKK